MAALEVNDDEDNHLWEQGIEATWDAVQERADGTLKLDEIVKERRRTRKRSAAAVNNVKRGMVR